MNDMTQLYMFMCSKGVEEHEKEMFKALVTNITTTLKLLNLRLEKEIENASEKDIG